MDLTEYITQLGDAKAAALWKVKRRTVASWRRRERLPRPEQAEAIVRTSPVTYDGIYGPKESKQSSEDLDAKLRRRKDDKQPTKNSTT